MNEWLDGLFGAVRCANCGAPYGRDSIALVGNREDYFFVRCVCDPCGTQGLGVVIVKRVSEGPPAAVGAAALAGDPEDRMRVDDVLEAHELLREYAGDARGLFEKVPGR